MQDRDAGQLRSAESSNSGYWGSHPPAPPRRRWGSSQAFWALAPEHDANRLELIFTPKHGI
jgi:hypothetical protein